MILLIFIINIYNYNYYKDYSNIEINNKVLNKLLNYIKKNILLILMYLIKKIIIEELIIEELDHWIWMEMGILYIIECKMKKVIYQKIN